MKNTFCNLSAGLVCSFAILALRAAAQSDTFDGNPDSSAFIRIPPDSDDWTRHFRIGAMVGMNISASFRDKATVTLPDNAAKGIYDDGYVRPDQTGDTSYTGYWGYNNGSQLSGNTLTMHSTTSFSPVDSDASTEDGSPFPGFDMAYGDNLWYWKHARVGWEVGFGLLPINISQNESASATLNQNVYSFNTGNSPFIPDPGYQGGPSGINEPGISTTRTAEGSQTTGPATVTGTRSLDVMLYTLRLGPSFYWDLSDKVGMSLGAGPAVGLVSGDYKYDETITDTISGNSSRSKGTIGGNEIVYGGYVNATVMYHLVDNGDIYIGAQYMPMTDATFSSSGREGQLNLGGQIDLTVGINWPF